MPFRRIESAYQDRYTFAPPSNGPPQPVQWYTLRPLFRRGEGVIKRRAEDVPGFLKKNANPIGLVMLGGAFGAVLTGMFSPSRGLEAD